MFTQDFFTENATHKQNCTSFNPKRVITYYVNNGKPFLDGSRSLAQIIRESFDRLHIYATLLALAYPYRALLAPPRISSLAATYPSQLNNFSAPTHGRSETANFRGRQKPLHKDAYKSS
ncbi:hypothetical protein KoxyNG13_004320 [Klebsiella pasteurii]